VRTTCPESLRSRVLTGNRTRDLLIASLTPYRCATTPRHATPWTYFLHLYLSSGILIDSSTGSPVHVLMLSTQAVRGLPRLHEPGIVPCIISFSRQLPRFLMVDHSTLERLALTVLNSSLFTPALLRTHSFVFFPLSTKHAESFSALSSQRRPDEFLHFFLSVQLSQPYVATGRLATPHAGVRKDPPLDPYSAALRRTPECSSSMRRAHVTSRDAADANSAKFGRVRPRGRPAAACAPPHTTQRGTAHHNTAAVRQLRALYVRTIRPPSVICRGDDA